MTDKELWAEIQADDSDEELKKELQRKLSEEMDKPISEQNFDYINELTKTLDMITGEDRITSERTARGIQILYNKIKMIRRKKRIKVAQRLAVCVCAVLVVSNVWTYSAFGMNTFSAVYQVLNGGITIDFSKQENSTTEPRNPYAEEMRQICNEHGVEANIPTYIPSGFKPTDGYGEIDEFATRLDISFYFKREKELVNFYVHNFLEEDDITPVGIPTDSYNITQQIIDGTTIHIITEDNQFKAVWLIGTTEYALITHELDCDESQRILESTFK